MGNSYLSVNRIPLVWEVVAFPLRLEFFQRFFGPNMDLRLVRTSSIPVNASVTKEWSLRRQTLHSPVTAAGVCPSCPQARFPGPGVSYFHREEKQRLKVHQNVSRVDTPGRQQTPGQEYSKYFKHRKDGSIEANH